MYFLRTKSEAQLVIPKFFNMVKTQFKVAIRAVRSDNAKELDFTTFFSSKGVIHYKSCVERPEQNSVVEHKHQHAIDAAALVVARLLHIVQVKVF